MAKWIMGETREYEDADLTAYGISKLYEAHDPDYNPHHCPLHTNAIDVYSSEADRDMLLKMLQEGR